MNSKKIMAGLLSAAMVVTSFAGTTVSVGAADVKNPNYASQRKVIGDGTQTTETTIPDMEGYGWDPSTFSDPFKITDKMLTITITHTANTAKAEFNPHYLLYTSDTGAAYQGGASEPTYQAGVDAHYVEYVWIRGDGWGWCGQPGASGTQSTWTSDGAIDCSAWEGAKYPVTLVSSTGAPWGDEEKYPDGDSGWAEENTKAPQKATITAVLQGDEAIVNYTFNGLESTATLQYEKTKPLYLALFTEPGDKMSNIKFSYASESAKSTELVITPSAKGKTYTGDDLRPTIKVMSGSTDVTGKFTISVVKDSKEATNFVGAGKYAISAKIKDSKEPYVNPTTKEFEIAKASQTIKLGTKKANKKKITVTYKASKLKKKKATFTVKLTGTKATNLAAKKQYTITTNKVSGKVGSKKLKITAKMSKKNTIKVTIPKKMPKGTYKFTVQAQQNDNYAQSKSGANTVTIKIK